MRLSLFLPLLFSLSLSAGEDPHGVYAFTGKTPKLDGVISPGEWDDATQFFGVKGWTPQFSPTTDPKDLSVHGYVKHDGKRLYFAFDVTDDVLYGIDTPRWLPDVNPKAHDLTREGFPWFGDEMELLINASNKWTGNENPAGNGSAWQMVCNLTKSRLGGVGKGGLLEGEPRGDQKAWDTYQKWITTGAQQAAAKVKPGGNSAPSSSNSAPSSGNSAPSSGNSAPSSGNSAPSSGKGYVIEWAVNFNPCLEVEPGKFYSMAMGDRKMGLNIALGDLDEKAAGEGNFGNFHHEDWFAGQKDLRTNVRQWGTLWIMAGAKTRPQTKPAASRPKLTKR